MKSCTCCHDLAPHHQMASDKIVINDKAEVSHPFTGSHTEAQKNHKHRHTLCQIEFYIIDLVAALMSTGSNQQRQ